MNSPRPVKRQRLGRRGETTIRRLHDLAKAQCATRIAQLLRDLMQTGFLQGNRDRQSVLPEHTERALRFLEIAAQKQEHGQPFGERVPRIAVKNATVQAA